MIKKRKQLKFVSVFMFNPERFRVFKTYSTVKQHNTINIFFEIEIKNHYTKGFLSKKILKFIVGIQILLQFKERKIIIPVFGIEPIS